jgi:hypothetical protein
MALTRRQFVVAAALACIGCAEQQSNKTAATGANMQTGMSSKQALFKSIDKNGDGNISQDEMKSWMESLDTDGNGALSDAEWAAAP